MSNRESLGRSVGPFPDLLLRRQSCILWRVPSLKSTLPIVVLLALGMPAGAQNAAPVAPKQAATPQPKVANQTKAASLKQVPAKAAPPKTAASATKAKKGKKAPEPQPVQVQAPATPPPPPTPAQLPPSP